MPSQRRASRADFELVKALLGRWREYAAPFSPPAGDGEIAARIEGSEPTVRSWLWFDAESRPIAFATLRTEDFSRRQLAELFALPDSGAHASALSGLVSVAEEHAGWELWLLVDAEDTTLKELLRVARFEPIRRYLRLEAPSFDSYPVLPAGVEIARVESEADFADCHRVQQSAYSDHFDFAPRTLSQWLSETRSSAAFDPEGIFLLRVNGEAAGFVECTDAIVDRACGYVHGIGVLPDFRRRGIGGLLLAWARAYAGAGGRASVELNVDCDNDSGAIRLYERAGFTPIAALEHWARRG